MSDDAFVQIETTTASAESAAALADALVDRRLAACAHVAGPIRSTYWWDGEVQHDEEFVVVVKTRRTLTEAVQGTIAELHDYEVPAVVVVDVAGGSRPYLDWIRAQTRSA